MKNLLVCSYIVNNLSFRYKAALLRTYDSIQELLKSVRDHFSNDLVRYITQAYRSKKRDYPGFSLWG